MIGPITPGMKQTGKRSAGKPHAAFDVAGAGNVTMVAGLRSLAKAMGLPPAPNVRAPALDPTCEGLGVKFPGATRPGRTDSCVAMECARARRRDAGRLMSRCADVARATAGGGLAGHRGVVRPWGAVKVTIFDLTCVGTRWRLKKHELVSRTASGRLLLEHPGHRFQFFLPPSCNACNAFSTPSEPETWLGGNSLNVERKWPMIIVAGIMTHNFLPHHSP